MPTSSVAPATKQSSESKPVDAKSESKKDKKRKLSAQETSPTKAKKSKTEPAAVPVGESHRTCNDLVNYGTNCLISML